MNYQKLFAPICCLIGAFVFPDARAQFEEVRVGLDLKPALQTFMQKGYTGMEAYTEASFDNKYFIGLSVGTANANRADSLYTYQNQGQYFKIHAEKNLLYGSLAQDALSLGLGYGFSSFSHSGTLLGKSTYWEDYLLEIPTSKQRAHWLESQLALKVKAHPRICLQAVVKLRIRLSSVATEPLHIAEIPGIGSVKSVGSLGVGYRVLYAFGKK